MDNDTFAQDPHLELSRILNKIARDFYEFECSERLVDDLYRRNWDINGNKVGYWKIKV